MNKCFFFLMFALFSTNLLAQDCFWVFFSDKNDVAFDPYSYFDEKAVARRLNNGISLYDETDFPLNEDYKNMTVSLACEFVGESRWFNAVAVVADANQIAEISSLPFVTSVQKIFSNSHLASCTNCSENDDNPDDFLTDTPDLYYQLLRMRGDEFVKNGIDGRGVRIAVFDGGFPGVDTHPAFAHLRKEGRILKTWNFPKNQENVYGWNSHGTMVLSCIAGVNEGVMSGLATGAEFLLARTEINIEPRKEEVWWLEAVEWADKNGADVINSSLGYGKARYDTRDMDGRSLVSRAANLAARKGMLVCNSMGNEATDATWKVLITPADADSVLSVGGIDPKTDFKIYFSSFGPTADGRLKPNVCALGQAWVANPKGGYESANGTSFSSPLVAGFAACAWQTRPGYTAMQMKEEIERSADKYPYFDYAYGYGVPQADYFLNDKENRVRKPAPTCSLAETERGDLFVLLSDSIPDSLKKMTLLLHVEGCDGVLKSYWEIPLKNGVGAVKIPENTVAEGDIVRALYCGYFLEKKYKSGAFLEDDEDLEGIYYQSVYPKSSMDLYRTKAFGTTAKFYAHPYFSLGFFTPPFDDADYALKYGKSVSFRFGGRILWNACKWYRLGAAVEVGSDWFAVRNFNGNPVENVKRESEKTTCFNFEFFQRFRIFPTENIGLGFYFDTGIYGSAVCASRYLTKCVDGNRTDISKTKNLSALNRYQWGVRARLGYDLFSVYAQYRISDLMKGKCDLPKLEVGVEISIPMGL